MGYKRYGSSSSIPTFNDDNNGEAVSNGILKNSSKKEIYFGIAKPKGSDNFRSLQNSDFTKGLQTKTDGCTATLTSIVNKLNIGQIRYNLSANTTGVIRNITFKYNNIDLFTIKQQSKEVDNNTYVYLRYWVFNKSTYENIITSANNTTNQYRFSLGLESEDTDAYISHEIWSSSGNIIYHVTNNKDLTNIFSTETSIKKLVDNGTLTYVGGKNFNNNTISSIIKFPTKMYENINTLVPVNDNSIVYLYSGSFEATVNANDYYLSTDNLHGIINWGNVIDGDVTSIGKYRYNQNTVNKKTYTIYLYKVETSLFTTETGDLSLSSPVYLFVSQNENKTVKYKESDSSYNYKKIDCKSTPNKNYTYFLLDTSHTLQSSNFNHKTISDLINNYNLTYESGTKLGSEDNDIIVNNISDGGIVNVWNSAAKGWFGYSAINNQRVMSVCLYNLKLETVIDRSNYYPKDVLNFTTPYAIYKIDV